jgi:hypothetical protein
LSRLAQTESPGLQRAGAYCADATQPASSKVSGTRLLAEVWGSCCDRHRQTGDEQGFALNRNGLAIFLHTFDVERYGFGDVIPCFLDSGSESMTTRQSRYIGVKRILVRLYDDRELVNRHLHMNGARRAPSSHLLKPPWTHIMPPGDDRMASWSAWDFCGRRWRSQSVLCQASAISLALAGSPSWTNCQPNPHLTTGPFVQLSAHKQSNFPYANCQTLPTDKQHDLYYNYVQ